LLLFGLFITIFLNKNVVDSVVCLENSKNLSNQRFKELDRLADQKDLPTH